MVGEVANSMFINSSAEAPSALPEQSTLAGHSLANQIGQFGSSPLQSKTLVAEVPFQVAAGEPDIKPLPTSSSEHKAVVNANKQVDIREAAVNGAQKTYDFFVDPARGGSVADVDMQRVELHLLNAKVNLYEAKVEQYSARADYKIAAGVGDYSSPEDRTIAYKHDALANKTKTYETLLVPLTQKAEGLSKDIADKVTVAQQNDDLVPVTLTEEADSRSDWAAAATKATSTFAEYKNAYADYRTADSALKSAGLTPIVGEAPEKSGSSVAATDAAVPRN